MLFFGVPRAAEMNKGTPTPMPEKTAISIHVRLRYGLLALQIASMLGLSACGGSDSPSIEPGADPAVSTTTPAAGQASDSANNDDQEPSSLVNVLSFEASGDTDSAFQSDGADLMLTGGCLDRNVIGMSFTRGQITDKDLFQLRLRTADSVAAGEAGTFPVSELGWYNGQFKPENLPTSANILVADAYEGSGTLTLTRHEGGGLNGRMAGTVEGTVKQMSGDNEAFIKAFFDINLGCSNVSLDGPN